MKRLRLDREPFDSQFNFNLSRQQHKKLAALAAKLGVTPSCLLRQLIDQAEHTPVVKAGEVSP
jgi:hypothetical protein